MFITENVFIISVNAMSITDRQISRNLHFHQHTDSINAHAGI